MIFLGEVNNMLLQYYLNGFRYIYIYIFEFGKMALLLLPNENANLGNILFVDILLATIKRSFDLLIH